MSSQLPLPNSPLLPITSTGNSEVDNALGALSQLDQVEIDGHAAIFTQIHEKLSNALTDIDN